MKIWVLNGDVLEVAEEEMRIPAHAEQVYASVLEDTPAWPDLLPGKSGEAAGLRFSRYPVGLAVVLALGEETGQPVLSFEARTQDGETFSVSRDALLCGHAVHEGTWYPSAPGCVDSIVTLLTKAPYNPDTGKLQDLGGILSLKKSASEGGPVIDRLPDDWFDTLLVGIGQDHGPRGIRAQLYPYQHDGWLWLSFVIREQLGGLLADEMGLGKTLQVLSALRHSGTQSDTAGSLIIAPGSLVENWMREIKKFCPGFRALKHHGRFRTGRPVVLKEYEAVVVSYDTVIRDLSLLRMIEWNVVVLDEAQNIRNPNALRTRSVKQIGRKVGLAVTGTPVENSLRDLWSIMDFVVPGYLGDLKSFEKRIRVETEAPSWLEPLISPLMLRRRVVEVARDLPERIDIPEILELSESEALAYDAIREAIVDQYGLAASLVLLGKLRQFCAHPCILEGSRLIGDGEFSKFERAKELLTEIFLLGEKALVFTSYTKMADRIARMASAELGAMSETLDGRLAIDERQPLIDRFSAHPGPAVLVLNPRAGGTGLNITAANHVIHYNPEWNPSVEDQASSRAHRRGQERPVTIRRLIFSGTVEEVIDMRLRRKRAVADAAVVGVEGEEDDYADILAALQRSPLATGVDQE